MSTMSTLNIKNKRWLPALQGRRVKETILLWDLWEQILNLKLVSDDACRKWSGKLFTIPLYHNWNSFWSVQYDREAPAMPDQVGVSEGG